MEIRYLEFFVKICETGNITSAAGELFISQQGLSGAVARLEAELGGPLFKRTPKGVEPTEAALILLPRARTILELLDECRDEFAGLRRRQSLGVACSYGVMGVLDQALAAFGKAHPDIQVHLSEHPDLQCEEAVESGQAEVGLTAGPLNRGKFSATLLLKHEVRAIVHRSHPLASRKRLAVRDLRGWPVITMNRNFRINHNYRARCRKAGFVPDIVTEVAEVALVHKLVEKGRGVGLTVDFLLRDFPKPAIRDLALADPTFVWDVHVATRRGKRLSPAGRAFVDFMVEHCGASQAEAPKRIADPKRGRR